MHQSLLPSSTACPIPAGFEQGKSPIAAARGIAAVITASALMSEDPAFEVPPNRAEPRATSYDRACAVLAPSHLCAVPTFLSLARGDTLGAICYVKPADRLL